MSDKRPILGDDAEPNPESKVKGKRTVKAAAAEPERPRGHEDDGEGYDAADDGPVEVPAELARALEEDARNAAELAGFTFNPQGG